jgi:transcriptional regulator with XRE-family HTH domain
MARARNKKSDLDYEVLKLASGWYLRAWRDYKRLTLDEVADEVNARRPDKAPQTKRGMIGDLENGVKRFNRDWLEELSAALDVTPGWLIDVNPMAEPSGVQAVQLAYSRLSRQDQQRVNDYLELLQSNAAKAS